jgi:hypothetical protein
MHLQKNPTKIWINRASIIYVHTNIEIRQKWEKQKREIRMSIGAGATIHV